MTKINNTQRFRGLRYDLFVTIAISEQTTLEIRRDTELDKYEFFHNDTYLIPALQENLKNEVVLKTENGYIYMILTMQEYSKILELVKVAS